MALNVCAYNVTTCAAYFCCELRVAVTNSQIKSCMHPQRIRTCTHIFVHKNVQLV